MSGSAVRTILAVLLIFHGVGHLMGILPALRLFGIGDGAGPGWQKSWSSRSWLLKGVLGDGAGRVVCAGLFTVALVGFLCAGFGLLGWFSLGEAWRTLAGFSSLVSLLAIGLHWNALILLFPHKIGALGVDAVFLLGFILAAAAGGGPPIPRPAGSGDSSAEGFSLLSPVFEDEALIPVRFTCRGEEISPPLEWKGVPSGTQSFALIMEDLDTPIGPITHWVLFNIPADRSALEENIPPGPSLPGGIVQGRNGMRRHRYLGPCPPWGTHRYIFHIFALDVELEPDSNWGKKDLIKAMAGHVLGHAAATGLQSRKAR